jgi:hypothetical protein
MIPGGFVTTRNLWSDNAAHVPAAGSREMLNSWLVALPDIEISDRHLSGNRVNRDLTDNANLCGSARQRSGG